MHPEEDRLETTHSVLALPHLLPTPTQNQQKLSVEPFPLTVQIPSMPHFHQSLPFPAPSRGQHLPLPPPTDSRF